MLPLRPEAQKSWNQCPGEQRVAGQEPQALVDAVPPALLPACGRGREPRSPSAQWLGGCGSRPRASPQGLEQGRQAVCRGRCRRASPAVCTERATAKPGVQGAHDLPAHTCLPTSMLPGAGPGAQARRWPQR